MGVDLSPPLNGWLVVELLELLQDHLGLVALELVDGSGTPLHRLDVGPVQVLPHLLDEVFLLLFGHGVLDLLEQISDETNLLVAHWLLVGVVVHDYLHGCSRSADANLDVICSELINRSQTCLLKQFLGGRSEVYDLPIKRKAPEGANLNDQL